MNGGQAHSRIVFISIAYFIYTEDCVWHKKFDFLKIFNKYILLVTRIIT